MTPWSSYGFAVIEFAGAIGCPLDPWQRWAVIHAGELLADGRPRFRSVLILVARQNGKTYLLIILALFWLFVELHELILGTSTNLEYARESWIKTLAVAQGTRGLNGRVDTVREANGQEEIITTDGCRYKIAAATRRGGRSLTIHRLICDELREHHDYSAYNAAYNAMNAVDDAQAWFITNMGDVRSVVLNDLHSDALEEIAAADTDTDTFLGEWSAPEGSTVTDPAALAAANPNLGRPGRLAVSPLVKAARKAERRGGDLEAGFKTEALCMKVNSLNPAVDPGKWADCLDVGDLAAVRSRVALCLDIAPDGEHATLAAAAVLPDDRVRLEVVRAWQGSHAVHEMRRDLPREVARVRPRVVGWLPAGPAAAFAADMRERAGWPPRGVRVEPIRGETSAVCMGFAEQVRALRIAQSGDPLLDAHVAAAEPKARGDAWVFTRRGAGHVDALYAGAGAVHLARTLPPPPGRFRVVVADEP